jgi:hypothetical protein
MVICCLFLAANCIAWQEMPIVEVVHCRAVMSISSSHFSGSSRSDRRRRLLAEDGAEPASTSASAYRPHRTGTSSQKSEHYGDGSFLKEQSRLTDLIPRGIAPFLLMLLSGVAAIAGLEWLYEWTQDIAPKGVIGRLPALDLQSAGSLAAWFSVLMLLGASVMSMAVYAVRRHRTDDYQGRYRIWPWAALGLFLVATDVAAGLHQTCRALAAGVSGGHGTVDASIWWIVPAVLLLGAVGSRALLDMWPSRLSIAAATMAAACYAVAVAGEVGWLVIEDATAQAMLVEGAVMGGHFLLFMTVALYARHVLLDAEGLLPRRENRQAAPRRSRGKKPNTVQDDLQTSGATGLSNAAASARSESVTQPAVATVKPLAPSSASAPAPPKVVPPATGAAPLATRLPAKTASPPSPVAASAGQESLSKADRKALKKRLLEERLKREQRSAGKW